MTAQLTSAQLKAFLALITAVVIVSIAPIVSTSLLGKTIPDALIAVSDKTVTGLIGVLGTLVGVMWQSRPKAADGPIGNPGDPVAVTPEPAA